MGGMAAAAGKTHPNRELERFVAEATGAAAPMGAMETMGSGIADSIADDGTALLCAWKDTV